MDYDAIIWDWNGTLLDDIDLCIDIANELLSAHRLPVLTWERYREIFDFPVSLYWERAGLDLDCVDFVALSREFCGRFEERLDETRLFPEALPVIEEVAGLGIEQFILSNTEHGSLLDMLRAKSVHDRFAGVQGMQDTLARGKQAGGRNLMALHCLRPERTLLVGDTSHDFDVAAELGIDCVLVSTGHHSHDRLSALECNVLRSLDELV